MRLRIKLLTASSLCILAAIAVPLDGEAQNTVTVQGSCNVVVQGNNNKVVITGATCPTWLPKNISPGKPFIIDGLIEFTGTTNRIEFPGKILFKKGGSIRVRNGGTLTIKARAVEAEVGAQISINAQGEKGPSGAAGRDGNGGAPGGCRDRAEVYDSDGRPKWSTSNRNDFIDANVSCDSRDLGRSCDFGLNGADSPKGMQGGHVLLELQASPKGVMQIDVAGGPAGDPGPGGKGSKHYHGGDQHLCPSGASGAAKVNPGDKGSCKIKLSWQKQAKDC